ncbi:MAG: hypothetical protein WC444_03975 [Candidatus Paceibacterota bacterium]
MPDKNKKDLLNSFELLNTYLHGYEEGNLLLYLPVSVELRKLLCETNPSPLISRVIPNFKLHKLHFSEILENTPSLLSGLVNFMPGSLKVSDNNTTLFTLLFAHNKEEIDLDKWVNQIFFKEGLTIRDLIKSVADKEGAHSDKNYDTTLIHCNNWVVNDTGCHILGIYAITKYLYTLFDLEYKQNLIKDLHT